MNKPNIILASASIGRKQLLQKLGLPFEVISSNVNEDKITHPDPYKMLELRAQAKAEAVANRLLDVHPCRPSVVKKEAEPAYTKYSTQNSQHCLIIAADSMAILNGQTYGKAKNRADAQRILTQLMGKTHNFVTATHIIYLVHHQIKKRWTAVTSTRVTFRKLTNQSLTDYITRYDFTRFAAGYALNETPWELVTKIDGSYTNVVGLPFEVILPIFRRLKFI